MTYIDVLVCRARFDLDLHPVLCSHDINHISSLITLRFYTSLRLPIVVMTVCNMTGTVISIYRACRRKAKLMFYYFIAIAQIM